MRTITSLGSFAVKNDGSEDFKTYVLEPLNALRESAFSGYRDYYYGMKEGIKTPVHWQADEAVHGIPILTVSQVKEFLSGTDLLASVPNDSSPVVSLTSAVGNSDEQNELWEDVRIICTGQIVQYDISWTARGFKVGQSAIDELKSKYQITRKN